MPKKRRVLLICIPLLVLLLVGAGVFLLAKSCAAEKSGALPPEPSALPTAFPTPTALPLYTPPPDEGIDISEPPSYMLPLVPIWDDGERYNAPPTPTPTPQTLQTPAPMAGVYDGSCKDVLLVGIHEGKAAAILLMRAKGDTLSILAIPTDTVTEVYELDSDSNILQIHRAPIGDALPLARGGGEQGLWNLVWAVRGLTGVKIPKYIGIDLSCMGEVLNALGGIQGARQTFTAENFAGLLLREGGMDASTLEDFGLGLTNTMRKVSLWELPALKKATKDKICGSLSASELIGLAMAIRGTDIMQCKQLPTRHDGGASVMDTGAAVAMLEGLYK
ncbi:MAG: hypothetical protein FWF10_11455 [Clostridiales bacterium]|nr:hypothetical protein [Clostridiales bacterium]